MTPDEILAARKALGLSQALLARVMRVRQATVSAWENGVHQPEGPALALIRAYLDGYRPADWPKG